MNEREKLFFEEYGRVRTFIDVSKEHRHGKKNTMNYLAFQPCCTNHQPASRTVVDGGYCCNITHGPDQRPHPRPVAIVRRRLP